MARDFKTLVRINDWNVDEKRRFLGQQLQQLANLESRLTALEEEIIREQNLALTQPTEAGLTYGAYAQAALDRKEALQKSIDMQEKAVEKARETLREAYLELKKYEVAEQRRAALVEAERAKAEQAELDEVGLMAHIRKS